MPNVLRNRLKNSPKIESPTFHGHARSQSVAISSTTASSSQSVAHLSPSFSVPSTSTTSRYPIPPYALNHGSPRTTTDTDGSGSGPLPFAGGGYGGSAEMAFTGGVTANRLETSKFILAALREVDVYMAKRNGKGKEPEILVPLGDAARYALGILEIIREIAHDSVEENLAMLALDACGLTYIVMDSCKQELRKTGCISNRTKVDLGGLTSNLNAIQTFVHKHLTRSFAKRLLKHGDDTQMMLVQRQKLKYWLTRFVVNDQVNEPTSIHDVLDRLVQKQLARANTRKGRSSVDIPVASSTENNIEAEVRPSRRKTWTANKPLPVHDALEHQLARPTPEESPHPHIAQPDGQDINGPTTADRNNIIRALPKSPAVAIPSRSPSHEQKALDDAEIRRKERLERQKAERKAERARWLKSEEEFDNLPLLSDINNSSDAGHIKTTSSSARQQRSRPPPIPLPRTDKKKEVLQDLESQRIAIELHRQTQRELVEEDEKEAKILAAKLEVEDRMKPARWSVESGGSMYAPLYYGEPSAK